MNHISAYIIILNSVNFELLHLLGSFYLCSGSISMVIVEVCKHYAFPHIQMSLQVCCHCVVFGQLELIGL